MRRYNRVRSDSFRISVAAITKTHIWAIDKLAAIGFEAVYAHIEDIDVCQTTSERFRVSIIRDHGTENQCPSGMNRVFRLRMDAHSRAHSILTVKRILYVQDLVGPHFFCRQGICQRTRYSPALCSASTMSLGSGHGEPENRNRHIGHARLGSVGISFVQINVLRRSMLPAPEYWREIVLFRFSMSAAPRLLAIPAVRKSTRQTPIQAAEQPFRTAPYVADNLRRFTGKA